jgi:hypothetical protein
MFDANDFKGFFKGRAALLRELAALRDLNKDLDGQVRDALKRKAITPAELEEFTRLRAEHTALTKTQTEITVFLRNNYPEMMQGAFAGQTLSQIVCGLLGQAKAKERPQ